MKKPIENSCDYRLPSQPNHSTPNGLAGEPISTAQVMAIPKTMPTTTNLIFISKVANTYLKTDCVGTS